MLSELLVTYSRHSLCNESTRSGVFVVTRALPPLALGQEVEDRLCHVVDVDVHVLILGEC